MIELNGTDPLAFLMVKIDDKPEPFRGATSILNWWSSIEQRSIGFLLKYRFMFITDITNCFRQINLDFYQPVILFIPSFKIARLRRAITPFRARCGE